jgi:hypothetical protein
VSGSDFWTPTPSRLNKRRYLALNESDGGQPLHVACVARNRRFRSSALARVSASTSAGDGNMFLISTIVSTFLYTRFGSPRFHTFSHALHRTLRRPSSVGPRPSRSSDDPQFGHVTNASSLPLPAHASMLRRC